MPGERALVLIPCSSAKESRSSGLKPESPVEGIMPLRERMVELRGDISRGTAVPAVSLYNGVLYNQCQGSIEAIASGQYPDIDLLIVSAYYGIVHPAEPIAKYDLRMGNEVAGTKVYRLWQQWGLGAVLEDYVRRRKIVNVWSLLSNSHPYYQYQQALNPFWKNMKNEVSCRQVTVPGGGQSNPYRRGEWLEQVLTTSPHHLVEVEPVPESVVPQCGRVDSVKRPIKYLEI